MNRAPTLTETRSILSHGSNLNNTSHTQRQNVSVTWASRLCVAALGATHYQCNKN